LGLFVAGSVACGATALTFAVLATIRDGWPTPLFQWQAGVVLVTIILAARLIIKIRVRSENMLITATNLPFSSG